MLKDLDDKMGVPLFSFKESSGPEAVVNKQLGVRGG